MISGNPEQIPPPSVYYPNPSPSDHTPGNSIMLSALCSYYFIPAHDMCDSAQSGVLCLHKEFRLVNIVKSGYCQEMRLGIAYCSSGFVEGRNVVPRNGWMDG